jgi:hypothetical protein
MCVLSRGMPQGASPSPPTFALVFDPFHSVIRDCRCGCTLQGNIDPSGSSGFVFDSPLHTDGLDAVQSIAIIVQKGAAYVEWAGMEINVPKSPITAIDWRTGKRVSTDCITLYGAPFPVVPPDQSHKYLGLRLALNGDFSAEKEYVCREMRQRLAALAKDRVLSRKEKELVIKTAVCTVFSYSAGFVDRSNTELEGISRMWIRAYKHAWALPRMLEDMESGMLEQLAEWRRQLRVKGYTDKETEYIHSIGETAASTYQSVEQVAVPTTDEGEASAIMNVRRDLRPRGSSNTAKDSREAAQ